MKSSNKPTKPVTKKRSKIFEWFADGLSNDKMALLETLVISILSIISWVFIDRDGITTSRDYFFWPMVGPILISLRFLSAELEFVCASPCETTHDPLERR